MKSIVFMGAKAIGYHCLNYLIKNKNKLNCEIIAVLADPGSGFDKSCSILDLAKQNRIKIVASLKDYLKIKDFDILISVQYYHILKEEHIRKAKQIAINLHMAPLPEYRGCNQFSFAILNKDKLFGATIHRLEASIDGGSIMFEDRFKIPPGCFVKGLYDLTAKKAYDLFKKNMGKVIKEKYNFVKQSDFKRKRNFSFHCRKEIEKIKQINPAWSHEKILRYFRATYMPGFTNPYIKIKGKKIFLSLREKD